MPRPLESTDSADRRLVPFEERRVLPIGSRVHVVMRAVFVTMSTLLALWVASDFLPALTWAALIAITAWPLYIRFATHVFGGRSHTLAPLLFTLLTGLVLVVPIILIVHQIAQGSDAFVRWVRQLQEGGIPVPASLVQLPIVGEYLDRWWQSNLSHPAVIFEWLRGVNMGAITVWTGALGGALLHRLFLFVIMLVALFVALRDGARLADGILAAVDLLLGHPGERLAGKLADAVRATVNGTVVVAVGEGALIGVAYLLVGLAHTLFFTLLTIALAMVPFGVWAAVSSASLALYLQGGGPLLAAGLFGFGATVTLIADNIFQPVLIAGATRLPFLLILIGILGGVQTFGLLGLFLGPVIMATVLEVWREWVGVED